MTAWTRIPADIPSDFERDELVRLLARNGLEVRQVKTKEGGTKYRRYVEYREMESAETE